MKTILVPTDFSETATNAAHYAIKFAEQMNYYKIILYNAYQPPPITDVNMVAIDTLSIDDLQHNSIDNLENFKVQLLSHSSKNIAIETLSDYGIVTADINDVCKDNNADIVVMGVTGGGKIEETLVGSFAVDVARVAEVPVIIVPPGAKYTEIKEVMLACDFTKIADTTPVEPIKRLLNETKAKLFVINIDYNQKHFKQDTPFESLMLDTLLYGYNPEYLFIDDTDFIEGINRVALEKEVDLIITIPKKMGWFDSLFKRSPTKRLAFHSHVPLMVIH